MMAHFARVLKTWELPLGTVDLLFGACSPRGVVASGGGVASTTFIERVGGRLPQFPVYMRLTSYRDWIEEQTGLSPLEELPTLVFPQYANGVYDGFLNHTRLILRNLAEASDPVTVEYLDSSGREVDSQAYTVPGSGTVDIQSSGTGDLSVGPLTIASQSPTSELYGTVIYDFLGYLVSVPSSQLTTEAEISVSKSEDENTGLALYNPSSINSVVLSFELHNANGESSGDSNITLEPGQHLALFVDDVSLFGDYLEQQQQFIGHVVISSEGGRFAMVSLLQEAPTGALAAVSPVGR